MDTPKTATTRTNTGLAAFEISLNRTLLWRKLVECARRIAASFTGRARCIMLSMHLNSEYVMRSFDAGACGYVVKDVGPDELTSAIARELAPSTKAVNAHRYQISQRLPVHGAAGMVRYAIRHGLFEKEA